MDKSELLRELLSDPETIETLKKILAEEKPKKKPVKKAPTKRVPKAKVTKEPVEENFKTEVIKKEIVQEEFVDDLTLAVTEVIGGKKVNLISDSKKFNKKMEKTVPNVRERQKNKVESKTCDCGAKFKGFGYLCDKCLRGRSINA